MTLAGYLNEIPTLADQDLIGSECVVDNVAKLDHQPVAITEQIDDPSSNIQPIAAAGLGVRPPGSPRPGQVARRSASLPLATL